MIAANYQFDSLEKAEPIPPAQHPVLTGGTFAFVSGEEPHHPPEVEGGHKGLEQLLAQSGLKYEPTDAHFQGKHVPLFIVHQPTRDQAMDLARRFGQESVIYSSGGRNELIYTNGPNAGKYHPAKGSVQFFTSTPEGGVSTRVPNAGHVRFNFDFGQLLDVPKKGSAMSEEHTAKNEGVSVADFKKALAKSLRNQIEAFSKSLEGLASREVHNNVDASVGDLKKNGSVAFSVGIGSSREDWLNELQTDYLGKAEGQDSYRPTCKTCGSSDNMKYSEESRNFSCTKCSEAKKSEDDKDDVCSTCKGTKTIERAKWGRGTQPDEYDEVDCPDCSSTKKSEVCKACKSEMCKCMDKGEKKQTVTPPREQNRRKDWQKRREIDSAKDDQQRAAWAARGHDVTIKSSHEEWKEELGKSDEWIVKEKKHGHNDKYQIDKRPPSPPPQKPQENKKSETFIDDKNAAKRPSSTDEAKKGGPRIKDVGLQNTDVAPPTKPVAGKLDEGSGGKVTKGKGLDKAAVSMSDSATPQGTGASLSASEKSGICQTKDCGRAAHKKGLCHDCYGAAEEDYYDGVREQAKIDRKAGLDKADPPMAKPPSGKNPTPANPPQAKPATPKPPPQPGATNAMPKAGPKLPKPKFGKAAIPMTGARGSRNTAINAMASERAHTGAAPGAAPAAAPAAKPVAKPPTDFSDFMPAGKFSGPGAGLPKVGLTPPAASATPLISTRAASNIASKAATATKQVLGKSEDFGKCLLCGNTEHGGKCE